MCSYSILAKIGFAKDLQRLTCCLRKRHRGRHYDETWSLEFSSL